MSARGLELVISGAARSGEVRGARWAAINLSAMAWTVPGERMKAGKEHRVPLSDAALASLNALPHEDRNALVFASPRGGMLSNMSLTAVLRRMKVDAVPHGFRSSFRDWCAERTSYPREVAEMALPHAIGDKVEAAYRQGRSGREAAPADEGLGRVLREPRNQEGQRDPDECCASVMVSFRVPC